MKKLEAFKVSLSDVAKVISLLEEKNYTNSTVDLVTYKNIRSYGLTPILLFNRGFFSLQELEGVKKVFNLKASEFSTKKIEHFFEK